MSAKSSQNHYLPPRPKDPSGDHPGATAPIEIRAESWGHVIQIFMNGVQHEGSEKPHATGSQGVAREASFGAAQRIEIEHVLHGRSMLKLSLVNSLPQAASDVLAGPVSSEAALGKAQNRRNVIIEP